MVSRREIVDRINSWKNAWNYQPVPFSGYEGVVPHEQQWHDTAWQKVCGVLKGYSKLLEDSMVLDVGCNLGYWAFQMRNFFNVGKLVFVEMNPVILATVEDICNLENVRNVEFYLGRIDDDDFRKKIPQCDVLIYLSIYHWIVYYSGVEKASRIFDELSKNCKLVLWEADSKFQLSDRFGWTTVIRSCHRGRNFCIGVRDEDM